MLVFDNFPAEKVEDLMQMATKESLAARNLGFTTPSSTAAGVDFSPQNNSNIASTPAASQPVVVLQNSIPKPAQANASGNNLFSIIFRQSKIYFFFKHLLLI